MLSDSVPGHHLFKHLPLPQNSILFHSVPKTISSWSKFASTKVEWIGVVLRGTVMVSLRQ